MWTEPRIPLIEGTQIRVDPLLDNARNTHAANNTGAVYSVVRAATVAWQRAIRQRYRWTVFSVLRGPCRNYITELENRMLLALASAIFLSSESLGTRDHI
jgi:hypothetical protein